MTTPDTDVRPPLTAEEQIAETNRRVEDLASTVLARASRRPTGTIEPTLRTAPGPDQLFLQGQTVSRTVYASLWQAVQDLGLGGFGNGDGSTTFVLPDLRGRTFVGATASRPVGTVFGDTAKTIAVANLPSHNHTGTTGADNPSHTHGGSTGVDGPSHTHYTGGNHGGHRPNQAPGVGGSGAAWPTTLETFSGDAGGSSNASNAHTHGFTTGNASNAHTHGFTTSSVGSGDPLNVESPAYVGNWLIWC